MGFLFGKKKKTDPVLEKLAEEIEESIARGREDEAGARFRRLEACFEEALLSGALTETQQAYYYDRIHAFRGLLTGKGL